MMDAKIQEAVDVVAAKWARLRHLRFRQVLAQQRLEQITEETMEASRVYDEAVEQLAEAARSYADPPVEIASPLRRAAEEMIATEERAKGICPRCGDTIRANPLGVMLHGDGRQGCVSPAARQAVKDREANPWGQWCGDCQTFHPVNAGETVDHAEKAKPYGFGLDDEPDGE